MRELAERALRWVAEGRPGLLVRAVTEQGFGPRRPYDALLLGGDGAAVGSLYQGAFDAHLGDEASRAPSPGSSWICQVAIHDREAAEAGLTCGGQAEVLLQPLDSVPQRWWELLSRGEGAALITGLDETGARSTSVVATADGVVVPEGPADPSAVEHAVAMLRRHRAGRDVRYTEGGLTLIEVSPPVPRLLIVGSGELVSLLVAQGRLLGWMATAAQDADPALRYVAEHPESVCLVMLSHDADVDVPVLSAALGAGVPYVGALGSRRTQGRRGERLLAAGVPKDRVESVHGPIGLELGARTPAETALAVCAEILAVLDGRTGRSLSEATGPINA
ncbi:XdhC family protein (plasmid) [Embleya sp. NBC_00888]|uniref:XdhC family protein n=1 Tax=Embleya sp. NBC_00888 TaxID=2975960 RepID=UPI002F912EC1|nr:XdhC family protein [Embleya sp. NBC_00888]